MVDTREQKSREAGVVTGDLPKRQDQYLPETSHGKEALLPIRIRLEQVRTEKYFYTREFGERFFLPVSLY